MGKLIGLQNCNFARKARMNTSFVARAAGAAALTVACMLGLAACSSSSNSSDSVAATVNGTEISEQTITDYIESFRSSQSLESEEDWGNWMASYSLDPSSVRSEVIDYFVQKELKVQAAAANGVEVTDDEVNEQVEKMKSNYSSDEAWEQALSSAGTTEDQYRDSVRTAMLESKLKEVVVSEDDVTPTDDEVLSMVSQYATAFSGAKRSSHILFSSDDEATAQQVLDQINNGEISFEDAAKQYSTDTTSAENGGDVGWDLLNSFVTDYQTALSNLEEGQVSGLVTSDYGIHIIKCTEVYTAPDEVTSLDQAPEALVEYVRAMVKSSNESTAYNNWLEDYKNAADIWTADMPSGLPYDLDMSKYQTSSDDSGSTSTSTDSTSADSSSASTDVTSTDSSASTSSDASTSTDGSASASDSTSSSSSTDSASSSDSSSSTSTSTN